MADLCRLCAAVHKIEMLSAINYDMCEKLNECFGIEICQHGDELPKCACNKCLTRLQETYEFFKRIKDSQESLTLLYDVTNNRAPDNLTDVCNLVDDNHQNSEQIGDVAFGTSAKDKIVISSKTLVFKSSEIVAESKQDFQEESTEIYQVLDSDGNNLLENFTLHHVPKEAPEIIKEQTEDSEEVETYILKIDDDGLSIENDKDIEENEDTEPLMVNMPKLTTIEILSQPNTANEDQQSNQTNNDAIQILEWKNYSWICHECSQSCVSFIALQLHAQEKHDAIDHNSLQYKCADCHKIIASFHKFLNHVRFRHHTELRLRCDVCDAQQVNYTELANHRKSVCCEAAELYPVIDLCKMCGKSFHDSFAISVHARSQHRDGKLNNIKYHKCRQCEKRFTRISNLRTHEKLHSGLKEFTCEICDRKFRQKNNLDSHLFTHIDDKVFKCKVCTKNFKTPSSLEKHHLIHKDIKKFTCDYCEKDFRTKDQKVSHERIHTGEKPFKCTFCDKSYRYRSGFMCHVNTHTGELPYACQNCDRRFSNWANMNKHVKLCKK